MQQQRSTDSEFLEFRAWLVYSAAATVATVVIILANPYTGLVKSIASAAIVLALLPLFWSVVRRGSVPDDSPRSIVYCLVATAAYLVALSLSDWANVALFVLSPQFFLLLSFYPAAIAIVLVNAGGVVVRWAIGDIPPVSIVDVSGMTLLLIAFSIFFGHRVAAVSKQSAERGRLIDRLRQQQNEIAQLPEQQGAAAERERIAREMHDTLAQGFTSIVTLGHAVQGELDADPDAPRGGYGLDGMAARVREAGGRFTVESTPGLGTGITAELPAPAVTAPDPAASAPTAPSAPTEESA